MIHAALKGKPEYLGAEDALTSVVFGLLRYLPSSILARWLQSAVPWNAAARRGFPRITAPTDLEFWPRWDDVLAGAGQVEPDAVLTFDSGLIIVEAKLGSRKGGAGAAANGDWSADQLARQWVAGRHHCERKSRAEHPAAQVYLTADLRPPADELNESVQVLAKAGESEAPLFWLSWSGLQLAMSVEPLDGTTANICEDLLAYMREAGVLRFDGWSFAAAERPDGSPWKYERKLHRYFESIGTLEGFGWRYRGRQRYFAVWLRDMPGTPWSYRKETRS